MKIYKKSTKLGYKIIIEMESMSDQKSFNATINYLIEKKNKSRHAKRGKIIMLPMLLRNIK